MEAKTDLLRELHDANFNNPLAIVYGAMIAYKSAVSTFDFMCNGNQKWIDKIESATQAIYDSRKDFNDGC